MFRLALVTSLVLLLAGPAPGQSRRGIQDRAAPSWGVQTWFNLPEGVSELDVADFAGRVVYLYCFQSW